jgi:hypothetical protein
MVLVATLALIAWSGPAVTPAHADTLAQGLRKQMPDVVKYLRKMGYKNVGVLKFRVEQPSGKVSDSVGTLNSTLAARVETALMLELDDDGIGVIRDASAVAAADIPGANHLTDEGRDKLFAYTKFPLRWGKQRVRADAFITGRVSMPAATQMHVVLCAFDSKGEAEAFEFDADQDTTTLVETGKSFLRLRKALTDGAFLGGAQDDKPVADRQKEAVSDFKAVLDGTAKNPALDESSPISLQVCYNGVPQTPVAGADGSVSIPEPAEGQKISFVLARRKTAADEVFGVVLKLNGENTLNQQTLPNVECLKWILEPGDGPITVTGYYDPDTQSRDPFRVFSLPESREQEINYGKAVGQISLVVFRKQLKNPPRPKNLPVEPDKIEQKQKEDAIEASAAQPGLSLPPDEPPPTITDAKRKALQEVTGKKKDLTKVVRGIVGKSGQVEAARVDKVKFEPDPVPVQTVILTYYKSSKP